MAHPPDLAIPVPRPQAVLAPPPAIAAPPTPIADTLYEASGIVILLLFAGLLLVRARRWNVAMLIALCLCITASEAIETYL